MNNSTITEDQLLDKISDLETLVSCQEEEILFLKQIIDSVPANIYWKDNQGVYMGRNAYAASKMREFKLESDTTRDDVIGKTDYDFFSKEVADDYRKNDLEVINKKKEVIKEEVVIDADGRRHTQLSVKSPLFDENGNVTGVIGNTIDITVQKEAEALRREMLIKEEKIKITQILACSIAHELRTPLAQINSQANGLVKYMPYLSKAYKAAKQEKLIDFSIHPMHVNTIEKSSEYISKAIRSSFNIIDMLLMNIKEGKIDANKFTVCTMRDDVELALEQYVFDDRHKDLLKIDYSNSFNYMGSAILTKHVIFNLLKNAIYYIELNNKGHISISLSHSEDFNLLIFEDTAIGIESDKIGKIFDKFVSHRAHDATGLGLAFCKAVMQAYGGDIICQSQYGEYAKFILKFPKILGN